jgi:hypothetical protein
MVVGDDELDTVEPTVLQGGEKVLPRLSRLAISTPRIWRRPSRSMPMATSTAWLITTPASRTFS